MGSHVTLRQPSTQGYAYLLPFTVRVWIQSFSPGMWRAVFRVVLLELTATHGLPIEFASSFCKSHGARMLLGAALYTTVCLPADSVRDMLVSISLGFRFR
jgi:hypothetical protein